MASELRIRPARLEDAAAITALHWSTVARSPDEVGPDILARWRFGGPWMAVESCAVHLNHLLRLPWGGVLVAEAGDEVIGEAEFYLSREAAPFGGLHLALLYVHRRWQRRGVGSALMAAVIERARAQGLAQITTQPEPEALSFYRRLGFRPWRVLHEMQAEAVWRTMAEPRPLEAWEVPPPSLALRIGRYQCGPQEWDNLFPPLVLPGWSDLPRRVVALRLEGQPVVLALRRQVNDVAQADGFAWLPPAMPLRPAIEALQALAAAEGYAAVDLLLPAEAAEALRERLGLAWQRSLTLWALPLEGRLSTSAPQV